MKKNITINLCGTLYAIDEDAYQLLERYLNEMKNYFKNQEGGEEIADDIEHRVAELFWELKEKGVDAITIEDVKEIIKKIGNPQEMNSEETAENKADQQRADFEETETAGSLLDRYLKSLKGRRMYRDANDKMVGGVCSGLTRFFGGSDPLPMRIILVLLAIAVSNHGLFWFWVILYLIFWVIMPEARTPEDKLKMEGKKVTPENLQEQILKEETEKTDSTPRKSQASGCLGTLLKFIVICFLLFWGGIFLIVLFSLIVAGTAVGGALFGLADVEGFGMGAGIVQFFQDNTWWMTAGLVCGLIGLLIPIYAIIRKLFSSHSMSGRQVTTLAIIWLISLIVGAVAGVSLTANWQANEEKYEKLGLDADGPTVTQPYDFRNFDELDLGSNAEVYYTQADSFEVHVEGLGSILNQYKLYQRGNKLCLEGNGINVLNNGHRHSVQLYISAPKLAVIHAQGGCEFHSDIIEQDSLQMDIQGAVELNVDHANVKYFTIDCKGAAEINDLNAVSDFFSLEAKGASQGNLNVKGQKVALHTSGASNFELKVDCDELEVHNSGASSINISGKAKHKTIDNSGMGDISTVDLNNDEETDDNDNDQ